MSTLETTSDGRPAGGNTASEPVGMIIGTEDSTPLDFWVGVSPESYLQLDDAVVVQSDVPGRGPVRIAGIVQNVRAPHEGASFDSDVFLVDRGVLPVETAVAAQVVATRFEPEIFVPPMPGLTAYRARGLDRERAMYFDQMTRRVPAGLSRDDEPVYLDLEFLACIPFVPERRFGDAASLFEGTESSYTTYAEGMGKLMDQMALAFRPDRVNVLMGHMFTDGARLGG